VGHFTAEIASGILLATAVCNTLHARNTGKEIHMIRTLLSLVVLAFVAGSVVGCHASATVDPHGATQLPIAR
jgi:hypothetical protein